MRRQRRGLAVLAGLAALAACSSGGPAVDVGSTTTTAAATTSTTAPQPVTTTTTTSSPPPTTSRPAAPSTTVPATLPALAPLLAWTDASSYTGVAALLLARNCTATLVDTGVDSGPAYVLTAGHCTEATLAEQNEVIVGRPTEGRAWFLEFDGNWDPKASFAVSTVAYATMKHLDLAVLQLDGTLGDLKSRGLKALPIARELPQPGTAVTNPAVPVQEVPDDQRLVRLGSCTAGATASVVEDQWRFDAVTNDCPGLRQGSSGSPLVAGGEIVGVVNTVADVGGEGLPCQRDHPCEVTPTGERYVPGRGYAVPVAAVAGCFGADGRFGLDVPGCALEPAMPGQVSVYPKATSPGSGTFAVQVRGPAELSVRVKQGRLASTRCDDLAGYGDPTPIGSGLVLEYPVPSEPGLVVTCVLPEGTDPARALAGFLLVEP